MHVLSINETDYNTQQFDRALEYLHEVVWDDHELVTLMVSDSEFKSWWINQWNLREDVFVWDFVGYLMSSQDFSVYLRDEYRKIHDVKNITAQMPEDIIARSIKKLTQKGGVR